MFFISLVILFVEFKILMVDDLFRGKFESLFVKLDIDCGEGYWKYLCCLGFWCW